MKQVDGQTSYSFYGVNGKLMYRFADNQHIDYYYVDGKLTAKRKGAQVTYLHSDYLGSPSAESNTAGTVTDRMYYQPFGESIGTPKDDAGYTGHKFDTALGLSYMQARYYDPVIGRFYSNDPVDAIAHLGNAEGIMGFNRYSYATNNPYKYIDPDGKAVIAIGGQGNANAGKSVSGAFGIYVDITSKSISWGVYGSGEAGASVAAPSAGAGVEVSVFPTATAKQALNGMYNISGVDVSAVSGDVITTMPAGGGDAVMGVQVSLDAVGTPTDLGVHTRTGAGGSTELGSADMPQAVTIVIEIHKSAYEAIGELFDD